MALYGFLRPSVVNRLRFIMVSSRLCCVMCLGVCGGVGDLIRVFLPWL